VRALPAKNNPQQEKKEMGKKDEEYTLTFKGLLYALHGSENPISQQVLDGIELYMRRNDFNAIVLDGGTFSFETVVKSKKRK
jgi:hypothetical protein